MAAYGFATRSKKYDVPLTHLDYDYIKNCNSCEELEKIIKCLRSGEEGTFPNLEQHAEKKLASVNPKSKVLKSLPVKSYQDLDHQDSTNISDDLNNWINSVKDLDVNLKSKTGTTKAHNSPIRDFSSIDNNPNQPDKDVQSNSGKNVKPRDFREWDKYNVEEELEKIDKSSNKNSDITESNMNKSKISVLPDSIDSSGLADEQKLIQAEREKNKGNEAIKAGDYDEAVLYYTRSLSITPMSATYNNRAQAYIYLKQWEKALSDCNAVLSKEGSNAKALMRRATSYYNKKSLKNAKNDLQKLISCEPNNKKAVSLLKTIETEMNESKTKGRKMVIEDVDSSSEEININGTVVEHPEYGEVIQLSGDQRDNVEKMLLKKGQLKEKCEENLNKNKKLNENSMEFLDENAIQIQDKHNETAQSETEIPNMNNACENKQDILSQIPTSQNLELRSNDPYPLPEDVIHKKQEGNDLFKKGQYGEAINRYTHAIEKLSKKSSHHSCNLSLLHNNRAICKMKIGNCNGCIEDCTFSLNYNPGNFKAIARRAQAYEALEKYKLAYVDYQHLIKDSPSDSSIMSGMSRCSKILRDIHGDKWRDHLPPTSDNMRRNEHIKMIPSSVSQSSNNIEKKNNSTNAFTESPTSPADLQAKFERLKEEGKKLVEKGVYLEAVSCYKKCIKICPNDPVPYCNSALCYLKMNKPDDVITNCNHALQLQEGNIKALFRRAQANKMKYLYEGSKRDLEDILNIDRKNTAARKELDDVNKCIKESKNKLSSIKKRKNLKIEEVDQFSDEEKETVKITDIPFKNESNNKDTSPRIITQSSSYNSDNSDHESKKSPSKTSTKFPQNKLKNINNNQKSESASKPLSEVKSSLEHCKNDNKINNPVRIDAECHSQVTRRSPYEFIQAWTSLKESQGCIPYAKLLDQIEPSELPKVLSNKLDGGMLSMIIQCVEYFMSEAMNTKFSMDKLSSSYQSRAATRALSYLQCLTKVARFKVVSLFMSQHEKSILKNILQCLEEQANCDILIKDLNELRKEFDLL